MLGKLRIVFYVVLRIIKVGKENEFLCCFKWEDGFFLRDVILRNLDELGVLDESLVILGVINKDIIKIFCLNWI